MTNRQKERNEDIMRRWENHGSIPIGRVFVLADMACMGEHPDGTFGDDECLIWEMFSTAFKLRPD